MQVYQMMKTMREQHAGCRTVVVSLLPLGPVGEKLKEDGFPVFSLDMTRGKPSVKAVVRLNQILKDERIDLVHSHLYHANLLGRLIKMFHSRLKLINTIHNIQIGGRSRERMLQLTNGMADSITIISEAARNHFIQAGAVPPEKLLFIPNGVDTKMYRSIPAVREKIRDELQVGDDFTWLAIGRLDEQKNYPNMFHAFARVLRRTANTRLLIAGVGPHQSSLEKLAASLEIEKHVHFLGYRKDIPDLMSAADAYVMSSDWEGMPLVLQEASSIGLPIVCTDVGGNREVVLDGQTGFIVKPSSPVSLGDSMMQMLEMSTAERKKMGEEGSLYMEQVYELDRITERWHKLYKQVLQHTAG
ncbi:glycosyltransferase [Domibacillus indicus]|uniref:glycosyltransferase n=1 Tax=Domibacillus indicus TaxID=1437523 RepID=UPI00061801F7|nr:glycosyltransferase [Domibacillus indicus]